MRKLYLVFGMALIFCLSGCNDWLDVRQERPVELVDEKLFFETIKKGFGQRRKTLLNSLTGIRGMPKESIAAVLADCGIDFRRRAETLSMSEFADLANEIAQRAE